MIGECITLKVFVQISEHAASPTELRARTKQHFPAITPLIASTNDTNCREFGDQHIHAVNTVLQLNKPSFLKVLRGHR